MKWYKIQNRSQKNSHSCVPLSEGVYVMLERDSRQDFLNSSAENELTYTDLTSAIFLVAGYHSFVYF
jgi:hypothetical protein